MEDIQVNSILSPAISLIPCFKTNFESYIVHFRVDDLRVGHGLLPFPPLKERENPPCCQEKILNKPTDRHWIT